MITCLTSLSRESIVLGSTLVAFQANDICLTRALASLDITVLVVRAFRVTVAGLKLKHPKFQDKKVPWENCLKLISGSWTDAFFC